jgi:hypothetical protein
MITRALDDEAGADETVDEGEFALGELERTATGGGGGRGTMCFGKAWGFPGAGGGVRLASGSEGQPGGGGGDGVDTGAGEVSWTCVVGDAGCAGGAAGCAGGVAGCGDGPC